MQFVPELCEVYQKTLAFLYDRCLQIFYTGASPRKDLTGTNKFMASIGHAVGVNKELVVDMKIFQFNYKLFCAATQKRTYLYCLASTSFLFLAPAGIEGSPAETPIHR